MKGNCVKWFKWDRFLPQYTCYYSRFLLGGIIQRGSYLVSNIILFWIYKYVLQHTPLKLVLCLIELILLLSIEVQYIFNSSQSVCKDGLENSCCILLWVVKRNWDLLYVYVTSIIVMPALRGHTECWVTQNAGPPSLGYISVNNLKCNKADQGRCLCFLGSLHSDKCRLKFIEKRLDLKII